MWCRMSPVITPRFLFGLGKKTPGETVNVMTGHYGVGQSIDRITDFPSPEQ